VSLHRVAPIALLTACQIAPRPTDAGNPSAVDAHAESETPARVQGPMDPTVVHYTLRNRFQDIRRCYEMELRSHPEIAGRVELRWVIASNGSLRQISVSADSPGMQPVARCIAHRMRQWVFPRPSGGEVRVNYPVRLEPAQP
jgi:hypothetical protein